MVLRQALKALIMTICFGFPTMGASGQQHLKYMAYLQAASLKVNNPVLSYRYRVLMLDNERKIATDSVSGLLFKSHDNYMDSNQGVINMVCGGYFLKADKKNKAAYVYNIASVQKKLGMKPEDVSNTLMTLTDSLLGKYGDLKVQELPEQLILTYKMKPNSGILQEMEFRISRKDGTLQSLKMTTDEQDKWGSSSGYSRVYYMDRFSNSIDPGKIDIQRFVSIQNGKATPTERLRSYAIHSLL
jgi:hypothetical protein